MDGIRRPRWQTALVGGAILIWAAAGLCAYPARAQERTSAVEPTGGPPEGAPRSRLTVSGQFKVDAYSQKNFFLGAAADTLKPRLSDKDAFITQELSLQPRFILADNLNLSLSLRLAQSIWGWNLNETDTTTARTTDRIFKRTLDSYLSIDWAFLSYRNKWSGTRWYVGRQKFGPGNLLVLDEDASGFQAYKDLPGLKSSFGLGYAKEMEWSDILRGGDPARFLKNVPRRGDVSLYFAEWKWKSTDGRVVFNPFYVSYKDNAKAAPVDTLTHDQAGATYLPDGQGYLETRFRPQISEATVIGVVAAVRRGIFDLKVEYDLLSGKDPVKNLEFGPFEMHDVNNGTLKGKNLYGDLTMKPGRFEFGGAVAQGSGDDDVRKGPGNFNYLHNQGHFSLTEVWGNGLALDERGIAPQGLGNPYSRGYRGLENTRIFQGRAAYRLFQDLRLSASYSMIRAIQEVRPFFADSATGVVLTTTYGRPKPRNQGGLATGDRALGSEIDFRVDWTLDKAVTVSLVGGSFKPGLAAGYLINGTKKYLKTVTQIRLGVSVPIREFSLGG